MRIVYLALICAVIGGFVVATHAFPDKPAASSARTPVLVELYTSEGCSSCPAVDKLVAGLKASFDFCGESLAKMDDSKLGDSVELFGGRQFPRAMAALGLASGWADHYAAAAMYLRLNNILPPSAQPKK